VPLIIKSTNPRTPAAARIARQMLASIATTGIYCAPLPPPHGSPGSIALQSTPVGLLEDFETRGTDMPLKMTDREVGGVTVVALDGRVVLGEETNAFREKIKALLAEGKKKILLNLANITLIDSTGLGTLVSAHHSASTRGASVRLCNLGTKFQEVLQVTKLLTVFDVSDTEADGVRSFSK
jgi:anti-sigma B factor antagonist